MIRKTDLKFKFDYRNNSKIFEIIGSRYLNFSFLATVFILLLINLIKSDMNILNENIKAAYLPAANQLPRPLGYFSESLGNLILARIFRISDEQGWVILHFVIIFLVISIVSFIIYSKKTLNRRLMVLIIFSTPAFPSMLQTIGSYDVFTFFGCALFVLLESKIGTFVATLIMVLGNPEQSILVFICVFILSLIPSFQDWRKKSIIGICTSIPLWMLIQIWMLIELVPATRLILIPNFIDLAIMKFWSDPLLNLWSYFGVYWIAIFIINSYFNGKERKHFLISLVIIPLIATLITADGQRVFALISFPILTITSYQFWNKKIRREFEKYATGMFLAIWLLIPSETSSTRMISSHFARICASYASEIGKSILEIGQNIL